MMRWIGNIDSFCFGRAELSCEIVDAAVEYGAVLLFGGRQAGKTTVLQKVTSDLKRMCCDAENRQYGRLPIYVDLLKLPVDADPAFVFGLLAELAREEVQRVVGVDQRPDTGVGGAGVGRCTLGDLETILTDLLQTAPNVDISFLFLLDEAKRVLGSRFPRAFQDNLFALLYAGDGVGRKCSFVFAGAQELYSLCEDDTSPIGSRAARLYIPNLDRGAVLELATACFRQCSPNELGDVAEEAHDFTGGHAGLTARLLRQTAQSGSADSAILREVARRVQSQSSGLFEVWLGGLTQDARALHDQLGRTSRLGWVDVVRAIREQGFDPSLSTKRAVDQLVFTGIAEKDAAGELSACNRLYWEVAKELVIDVARTQEEQSVWDLIEQVELTLRSVVGESYRGRWNDKVDKMYEQALGGRAWQSIQQNIEKRKLSYPRSKDSDSFEILEFTYLGQLITLMCWGNAWDMFQEMFRDRRELEDLGRSVGAVRNDRAHFREVPERELRRCRLACEDLLAVTECFCRAD